MHRQHDLERRRSARSRCAVVPGCAPRRPRRSRAPCDSRRPLRSAPARLGVRSTRPAGRRRSSRRETRATRRRLAAGRTRSRTPAALAGQRFRAAIPANGSARWLHSVFCSKRSSATTLLSCASYAVRYTPMRSTSCASVGAGCAAHVATRQDRDVSAARAGHGYCGTIRALVPKRRKLVYEARPSPRPIGYGEDFGHQPAAP